VIRVTLPLAMSRYGYGEAVSAVPPHGAETRPENERETDVEMSTQARLRTQQMRRVQKEAAQREARRRSIVALGGSLLVVALLAAIPVGAAEALVQGIENAASEQAS
jgi:hypothetical protein